MEIRAEHEVSSLIESRVLRVRQYLEQDRFAEALSLSEELRHQVPQNRDVLYMHAVSLRNMRRTAEALQTLKILEEHHPKFSRLYQERGYCYVALRDAPNAIAAFLIGVNLNPALPASWAQLEGLFRITGQIDNARMAAEHVATLANLAPEVTAATGLYSDGELVPAENLIREYLLRVGNDVEGMRLLAKIGMDLDVLDDAEFLLESVLAITPNYSAARYDYARVLLKRHKHVLAMAELDRLLANDPKNPAYRTTYATACIGISEHEKALAIYRSLLDETPRSADIHLSVAHALKTLGRTQEAIETYQKSAALQPKFGDAYWSLANLKTYRFTDAEFEVMRREEASDTTQLADRYHLCFALGKALEDRGDYSESFAYYQRGNALKKSESRFKIESVERNTRLQIKVCTKEFFAQRKQVGCVAPDPIFIVGLPRSGSTLLEQILASHSRVDGTMELADISRIVQDLLGRDMDSETPRYPGILAEMPEKEFLKLGERYLEDTRVYRGDRPFFIDKMPNNFRHIGLIHLMLPNAKIIDARREPMACCFSNFKQLFATGQEFTYSLDDIARYYRSYVQLMAHWDMVLPGSVLRVQHEQVVDDLEANVRRILDFCGLEFEPACVEFHKNSRSVHTASSEQVRKPIYRDGLDQWRNYEAYLGPLRQSLDA